MINNKYFGSVHLAGGVVKFDISDSMYSRVRQDFGSRVDGIVEDSKGYVWLTVSDGGIMKSTTPVFSLDTHFEPWKKASDFSGRFHIYLSLIHI